MWSSSACRKLKHLNFIVYFWPIQVTQLLCEFPCRSGGLINLSQEMSVSVKCVWYCVLASPNIIGMNKYRNKGMQIKKNKWKKEEKNLISRCIEVLNCVCVSSHWRAEESKKQVCFDQATRYCIKSRTIKPSGFWPIHFHNFSSHLWKIYNIDIANK